MFKIKKLYPKKWQAEKISVFFKSQGEIHEIDVDVQREIFDLSDLPGGGYAFKMIITFGGKEKYQYDLESQFHNRNPMSMSHRDAIVSAMTSEKLDKKSDIANELAVRDEYIEKLELILFQAVQACSYYADADYSSTMESKNHIVRDCGQKAREFLDIKKSFDLYDPHHLGIYCFENKTGEL